MTGPTEDATKEETTEHQEAQEAGDASSQEVAKIYPFPKRLVIPRRSRREKEDLSDMALYDRPVTRLDCLPGGLNEARPCPFVSCKYHLALDVTPSGNLKVNFPHLELEQMPHTCALDVADDGSHTLEDVGTIMNLTRERVRQMEKNLLARLDELDASPKKEWLYTPAEREIRREVRLFKEYAPDGKFVPSRESSHDIAADLPYAASMFDVDSDD